MAALAVAVIASTAIAQEGERVRLRGTIDTVNGDTLAMTTGAGEQVTLTLTDETRISGTAPRSIDDIGPGTFLASAGERRDDGRIYAVEVRIFDREIPARQFEYDLGPQSVMTNAPVAEVMSVGEGNVIKVTLEGGEAVEYVIEPDVPIYVTEPADRSLLVPGAYIVVNGTRLPDGTHVAGSITAERDGLKPAN